MMVGDSVKLKFKAGKKCNSARLVTFVVFVTPISSTIRLPCLTKENSVSSILPHLPAYKTYLNDTQHAVKHRRNRR